MKAVGYIRVSSEMQKQKGSSLQDQKEMITEAAKRDKNELVKIFEDGGISGGSVERPALQELLHDAHQNKFSVLYFSKLDRLGRSTRDIFNLYHELNEKLKIDLISVSDPSLNTVGPMGKVLLGVLSVFSEFERTLIRDRMHNGALHKWRDNKVFIGSIPFGYKREKDKKGRVMIDPVTSKTYLRIIDLYLNQRLSIRKIANELSRLAIPTPSKSKNKTGFNGVDSVQWTPRTILAMLKSPSYTGKIEYNVYEREWINGGKKGRYMALTNKLKTDEEPIITNFVPLISKEKFQQIQLRIESQRRTNKHQNADYPFMLGHFIKCSCGERIYQLIRTSRKGDLQRRYKCKDRKNCQTKVWEADEIEGRVFTKVMDVLCDLNTHIDSWVKNMNSEEIKKDIKVLNDHIKKADKEWNNGFEYIRTIDDLELKETALSKQKEFENQLKGFRQALQQKQEELSLCENKSSALSNLKKLFRSKAHFRTKSKLKTFLQNLPFDRKRKLIEALVSPESGGFISIGFAKAGDIYDETDDPDRLLIDDPPEIICNFQISPDRITNIIEGLDKKELDDELRHFTHI